MKIILAIFALALSVSSAQAEGNRNPSSAMNKADDQALGTQAATDLTRSIREKIMANKSLSTKAQNIQIITNNSLGVELKGNVSSASEKQMVESIAKSAGAKQVINNTVITK